LSMSILVIDFIYETRIARSPDLSYSLNLTPGGARS
jgi:hypothetical protein